MKVPYGLTAKQAATVVFVGTFVTVIGGIVLAFWYRRKNRRASTNA